ncbi:MAG: hydrogenase maturation protease [Candidatus Cloacimonetes bacterium]|jgi:hydrogenase maturation protease|nr:hydrogenase maturation protease [Candidatus Cloacimonadota bacterium]MBT6994135.1 hydrogenase maturation protease [Candidatus Cloacimonadota bacterium]MBT7469337.1 hydrogenase maturation protease [Candidatus Cloacimonadota bacterium]
MKILIYGYGNPSRQDDALGVLFTDKMEVWAKEQKLSHLSFDTNYQLNIEDADTISAHDVVYFVDASMEPIDDFSITKVESSNAQIEFTMHAISAGVVLDLCNQIYGKAPETYLIHIKGYEWDLEFDKGLSSKAENNLQKALAYLQEKLMT